MVQWHYEDGLRSKHIDRMFVLDVRRDPYDHDRALLDRIVVELGDELNGKGSAVLVVEDAVGARLYDPESEQSTGKMRSRITRELSDVWYERVEESFRFTFPADSAYELEIADDGGATVLFAAPGSEPGRIVHAIRQTEIPEDEMTVTRRYPLLAARTEPSTNE